MNFNSPQSSEFKLFPHGLFYGGIVVFVLLRGVLSQSVAWNVLSLVLAVVLFGAGTVILVAQNHSKRSRKSEL